MIEKKKTLGLMAYLETLRKLKSREEEANAIINNTLRTLSVFQSSIFLIYSQSEPLKKDIQVSIDDEDFKDKVDPVFNGVSIRINNYFDQIFNLLSFREEEATVLSDCITELIKVINDLCFEKEAKLLEPIEKEVEKGDIFEKLKGIKDEDYVETDIEEDEEVAIPISKYVYKCEDCKNSFKETYQSGCRRCGGQIFKVTYI